MTFAPDAPHEIWVRGAREHNLRNIDVRLPRDQLVVITGLSGSGKSSLAFDTLYAEGQRRYVESLSAYARQFLDQMSRPDVDAVEGLSPAISIEQRTAGRNPRSTVGTATEIYDHLRLLYARAGEPHCWECGEAISNQSVAQIAERVMGLGAGAKLQLLAPVVRGRKGAHKKEIEALRRQGYTRARIDGQLRDLSEDIALARHTEHSVEVVIDRIAVQPRVRARLSESLETALRLGDGHAIVDVGPQGAEWLVSERQSCPRCGTAFPELAPRLFSFNSPHGACSGCGGLGARAVFDPDRVVPERERPLATAIAPWTRGERVARYYRHLLASLAEHFEVSLETPWAKLPAAARRGILHGTREPIEFRFGRGRRSRARRAWDGVLGELERRRIEKAGAGRDELARYASAQPCDECGGGRLRPEAQSVKLGGLAIHELAALPIERAARFLDELELPAARAAVAERVVAELRERLRFLCGVGLGYLSLDRASRTLSGGEAQRIRLATQVGAQLMGVLYVLDEPSIGLHPRDNQRLLRSLRQLQLQGNSVIVVEHDEETIRAADWVIDMGPGAGIHGGVVVAEGTPQEVTRHPDSLTGAYLSGRRAVVLPGVRRRPGERRIALRGCRAHNLKNIDIELPLGLLVVVSGVSGSGKSTLVHDTLHRALAARLHRAQQIPGSLAEIRGVEHLDKVILVDQAPIGRTPRSNAATYTGVFDGIRRLFAGTAEARMRGHGAGRFSFNVKGGRCEACHGDGVLRVEMHFLPDFFVTCASCRGRRYTRETLEITYRDKTIADVLDMTVEEAIGFMENLATLRKPLETLRDVGLGYLHLGQPATTLSGGEAQRIKLARELARRATGRTLYILDEPTTGLHLADVERLLTVLGRLVDAGNSVLVIEHHPDVIKSADWVIDLGPEGGEAGGELVAAGTPEQIAREPRSHTGRAVAGLLSKADARA